MALLASGPYAENVVSVKPEAGRTAWSCRIGLAVLWRRLTASR